MAWAKGRSLGEFDLGFSDTLASFEPEEYDMATCDSCHKMILGAVCHSVTGREICSACSGRLLGQTAGIIVGGPTTEGQVGSAIAVSGWLARLKRMMSSRE